MGSASARSGEKRGSAGHRGRGLAQPRRRAPDAVQLDALAVLQPRGALLLGGDGPERRSGDVVARARTRRRMSWNWRVEPPASAGPVRQLRSQPEDLHRQQRPHRPASSPRWSAGSRRHRGRAARRYGDASDAGSPSANSRALTVRVACTSRRRRRITGSGRSTASCARSFGPASRRAPPRRAAPARTRAAPGARSARSAGVVGEDRPPAVALEVEPLVVTLDELVVVRDPRGRLHPDPRPASRRRRRGRGPRRT